MTTAEATAEASTAAATGAAATGAAATGTVAAAGATAEATATGTAAAAGTATGAATGTAAAGTAAAGAATGTVAAAGAAPGRVVGIVGRGGPEPPAVASGPGALGNALPRLRLLGYELDAGRPAARQQVAEPVRRPQVVPEDRVATADLRRHVERVLRLALEVLDGRRPLAQLAPHLAPGTMRYLRAAMALRPPLREPSRMTSLHLGRPCRGVAEVAVVYRRGPRARALAARFERGRPATTPTPAGDRPEWRCVTLRLL